MTTSPHLASQADPVVLAKEALEPFGLDLAEYADVPDTATVSAMILGGEELDDWTFGDFRRLAEARTALDALNSAGSVPMGGDYRLVPVEPTEAMVEAGVAHLSDDIEGGMSDREFLVAAYGRMLSAVPAAPVTEEVEQLRREWRCFHCDEVFTSERCARSHFGRDEGCAPACQIKAGEGGLVEALRRAEDDAADAWHAIHAEATDAAKAYRAQAGRHREQLIAIEQVGYERGLADAQAHPETLGLIALLPSSTPASAGQEQSRVEGELVLTRDVTKVECPWLDADLTAGMLVFNYPGPTYGCVSPNGRACSLTGDLPFFELPRAAIENRPGSKTEAGA